MKTYYFDIEHNRTIMRDEEGSDHTSEASARRELYETLLEILRHGAKDFGCAAHVDGVLRDAKREIWRGRLSLRLERAR